MARQEHAFVDGCFVKHGTKRMGGELWSHARFGRDPIYRDPQPELILDKGREGQPFDAELFNGWPVI
jgi:hypothetical protein